MSRLFESELHVHQNEQELDTFCEFLNANDVRSYLEIGSKFGGSLWRVGGSLPTGSKVVAVDMPYGTRRWPETEPSLKACVAELRARGIDAHIIWGNSTDAGVISQVIEHGPYDCVLIDANHTLPFLKRDWENYSSMAKFVAFHDISWKRAPEWRGISIDVPAFWNEKKKSHNFVEFRFDPKMKDNGIGVLWR